MVAKLAEIFMISLAYKNDIVSTQTFDKKGKWETNK